jgi:hypothetical protein
VSLPTEDSPQLLQDFPRSLPRLLRPFQLVQQFPNRSGCNLGSHSSKCSLEHDKDQVPKHAIRLSQDVIGLDKSFPLVVLSPQCDEGEFWTDTESLIALPVTNKESGEAAS